MRRMELKIDDMHTVLPRFETDKIPTSIYNYNASKQVSSLLR